MATLGSSRLASSSIARSNDAKSFSNPASKQRFSHGLHPSYSDFHFSFLLVFFSLSSASIGSLHLGRAEFLAIVTSITAVRRFVVSVSPPHPTSKPKGVGGGTQGDT